MIAAWRRGGFFDSDRRADLHGARRLPRVLHRALVVYFLGLKLGWFPIQHAYDNDVTPGANWPFVWSATRHGVLPALVIVLAFAGGWVLNMRTVMINTISEDYVAMAQAKGLRDRRVMTRYAARNAILPPLNGFAPQFATAVGGVIFIELVFSYPGAGYTLQQAALGNDYPLTQALLLVLRAVPDRRELHHGHLEPHPRSTREDRPRCRSCSRADRPARSRGAVRRRGRSAHGHDRPPPPAHHPGLATHAAVEPEGRASAYSSSRRWCCSACSRRSSSARARRSTSPCSTRGRHPSWHHLFGTTDQGSDVFAQVAWGARRSLAARSRGRRARDHRSRRRSASSPRTPAASSTSHQPHHQRLLRHPDDPAARRRHRVPAQRGHVDDDRS